MTYLCDAGAMMFAKEMTTDGTGGATSATRI